MKPLIVYDGTCNFCIASLNLLSKFGHSQRFAALPNRDNEVYRRFPHVDREQARRALLLILPNGRVYEGAAAFREIFLRVPGTWLAGQLMRLPGVRKLAPIVYRWIARHRDLLSRLLRLPPGGVVRYTSS